jgi:phosphatidylglycerol:prolipoprotein diacylglycerol transferase
VGGYFGVELAKWTLGIRTKTGDSFAVPVAAAVAIGRLGCFHAGCCYGTLTNLPWGVVFPAIDSLPRHPTQLYEAAFHVTAAATLYGLQRRGLFRGQLIKLYILSYLAFRFVTELIRPEARLAGGLTGYQWAAIVLAALFAWLWVRDARVTAREAAGTT